MDRRRDDEMDRPLRDATVKFQHFKSALELNNLSTCKTVLDELKVIVNHFSCTPPFFQQTPNAALEFVLARQIHEQAVLLSVKTKDLSSFQDNFARLKLYYTDTRGIMPESPLQYHMIGLNLLKLLVEKKLEEFQNELDNLPSHALDVSYLRYVRELKVDYLKGDYRKLFAARQHAEDESYLHFVDLLTNIARVEISPNIDVIDDEIKNQCLNRPSDQLKDMLILNLKPCEPRAYVKPPITYLFRKLSDISTFDFSPSTVSIGPYNSGIDSLVVKKLKRICFDYLIRLNCDKGIIDYVRAYERLEPELRRCYREVLKLDRITFAHKLMLDASFILVYLRGTTGFEPTKRSNKSSVQPENSEEFVDLSDTHYRSIVQDVLMYQNQMPFDLIRAFYRVLTGGSTETLFDNIGSFLETNLIGYPFVPRSLIPNPNDIDHLLHFVHRYFRPTSLPHKSRLGFLKAMFGQRDNILGKKDDISGPMRWRRALEYRDFGIKFKPTMFDTKKPHSLLDLQFTNGTLQMPTLHVDESTLFLLSNFVLLEKSSKVYGNDLTTYVVFISSLLSTADDVAFLGRKNIVLNHLNNDAEVAQLISQLRVGVEFGFGVDYYLKPMGEKMEKWSRSKWNKRNAWLFDKYFKNVYMLVFSFCAFLAFGYLLMQIIAKVAAYLK